MECLVIDVREPEEFAGGHIEGALNIPPMVLMEDTTVLADVPKDTPLIVYCRTGSRSNVAINILRSMGFTNLTNGINKDHVETKYGTSRE